MEKSNLRSTTFPQTSVNINAGQAPRSPMGSPRQTPPAIASGAQEAPSLVDANSSKLQSLQCTPQALKIAINILKGFMQKDFSDASVGDQIFKVLSRNSDLRGALVKEIASIRNAAQALDEEGTAQIERLLKLKEDPNLGTTVIDHIYLIKDEEAIHTIETLLDKIIDVSPNEILKLLDIFNKTISLSTPISNYIFEYLDSVKGRSLISEYNGVYTLLMKISLGLD